MTMTNDNVINPSDEAILDRAQVALDLYSDFIENPVVETPEEAVEWEAAL